MATEARQRFRELCAAPQSERWAVLLNDLRQWLAEHHGMSRVDPDASFHELFRGGVAAETVYDELERWAVGGIGFAVLHYLETVRHDTPRRLCNYLAGHIEPPPPPVRPGGWQEALRGYQQDGDAFGKPYRDGPRARGRAVFVLGAPRSGTTMFRLMLGAHPDLLAWPELYLLGFDSMAERRRILDANAPAWIRDGVCQAVAERMGLSVEQAHVFVEKLESRDLPVAKVYDLLRPKGGGVLVDKSMYGHQREVLRRAGSMFENPCFLHITRHPYAAIESRVRMRMGELCDYESRHRMLNPWDLAEVMWVVTNRTTAAFLDGEVPAERWLHLKYEDLVADPEGELRRVCEMLEIPFAPAMADPYRAKGASVGVGDPNQKFRNRVEPALAEAWKNVRLPYSLSAEAREIAERYGYECV